MKADEIPENAAKANERLLPKKSKASQDIKYKVFMAWKSKNAISIIKKDFRAL